MSDTVIGFLYTHWDCPECGHSNEEEGDASSESVECVDCGEIVTIREVR